MTLKVENMLFWKSFMVYFGVDEDIQNIHLTLLYLLYHNDPNDTSTPLVKLAPILQGLLLGAKVTLKKF